MSENDEKWALVDILKEFIESIRDEPHFTVSEHALMAAGEIERAWLAAHDAEVAERIAQAIEGELRAEQTQGIPQHPYHNGGMRRAARIAREVGK